MNERASVYLQEEEVEHVIRTLSSHTSARDLAEALGRSEEEVVQALQTVRASRPADDTVALRTENEELKRRIEALENQPVGRRFLVNRGIVFAVLGSLFLLVMGVMFAAAQVPEADATAPETRAISTPVPAGIPAPDPQISRDAP